MRGWGSIPAGASPPWPREKPGASGWALRVPSAAAGVGPIVCSPGEGSRGREGRATRSRCLPPKEGPACPFLPWGPPACTEEPEPCRAVAPGRS